MHATAHKEEGSRGRSNPAQLSQFWRSARPEVGGEALSMGGASACCRHSPRSERAARDAGMHRDENGGALGADDTRMKTGNKHGTLCE